MTPAQVESAAGEATRQALGREPTPAEIMRALAVWLCELDCEARARRVANRAGLVARKSRWRKGTIDNYGLFMLLDPHRNIPVHGWRYDMSPEEVIEYCSDQ